MNHSIPRAADAQPPTRPLAAPALAVALPLIPVLALIASVFLPFVNDGGLWLGLPKLFLWTALWVLVLTPMLLISDRLLPLCEDEEARR